jgi:hypothetical protein
MAIWTFCEFVDAHDRSGFDEWIDSLPIGVRKKVRVEVNALLQYLALCEAFVFPYARKLHGAQGLWEIRIKVDRTQYRPLGFHGPMQHEATILTGAVEKGGKLKPASAIDTAIGRMNLAKSDRSFIREFEIK